jgi:hypothetical protein
MNCHIFNVKGAVMFGCHEKKDARERVQSANRRIGTLNGGKQAKRTGNRENGENQAKKKMNRGMNDRV